MEKLMGVDEIAALVGVEKSTIYQWTSRGLIPVVRLSSRCVKFSQDAITAWLAEKSSPASPQKTEQPPKKSKKKKSKTTKNVSAIVDRAKKEVLR